MPYYWIFWEKFLCASAPYHRLSRPDYTDGIWLNLERIAQAAAETECSSLPSPEFQLLWIHSTITKFFIKLLNLFTIQFSISTHHFEAISLSHVLSMNRRVLIHGRQWKIYFWGRFPSLAMPARQNIHLLGDLAITPIWAPQSKIILFKTVFMKGMILSVFKKEEKVMKISLNLVSMLLLTLFWHGRCTNSRVKHLK